MDNQKLEIAVFAGGCFWCVEAVFQRLRGVASVESGYSGGRVQSPSYDQVSMGQTGHAEVLKIAFNPGEVTFATLLEVFFATHDPTTLNQQGNDVGTQYRSAIFYSTEQQKVEAEQKIKALEEAHTFDKPVVTEVAPLTQFYPAEKYHQNYFNTHSTQPYCSVIIGPKIKKLEQQFAHLLSN